MERNSGFTLHELLISLAIAAALIALALPSFTTLLQNNRLTTLSNEIIATVHYTRSEAIRRGQRVTLCKGTIEDGCDESTQGWEQGWLVFVDQNNNGLYEDTEETLLRTRHPLDETLQINANGQLKYHISFLGDGFSRTASGALPLGTLAICDQRGNDDARSIIINRSGRPRVEPQATLC